MKTWMQVGFGIGLGVLMVYNLWTSPSTEDLERVTERADSVAAAVENEIEPLRKEKEAAATDRKAMREALRLLQAYLEPTTIVGGNP